MRAITLPLTLLLGLALLWSCDVTATDHTAEIENTLLRLLEADDSSYTIIGMEDTDDLDLLGKGIAAEASTGNEFGPDLFDSLSIWRFGRTGMQMERDITIDVEGDTAATATIVHHISGTFHVRQYERTWTSDSTWERGDSIRFSEKPMDLTMTRRVQFRERETDGARRWRVTAITPVVGGSATCPIDLVRLEWIAEDTTITLENFGDTFYELPLALEFATEGTNEVRVYLTSDMAGESEAVVGKWHHHPRLQGPHTREQNRFAYVGTNAEDEKMYMRMVDTPQFPNRRMQGFIDVIDHRTLFDHDYINYDATSLGLQYWLRRHAHHGRP